MSDEFRTPYPGYDVLAKWDTPSWNDQTRRVIADRLDNVPPRRFFTEREWEILKALCDCVLPQPERGQPVPIAPFIDAALFDGRGTGTRYADMPEGGAAWRQGLAALQGEAKRRHGKSFASIGFDERSAIVKAAADGDLSGRAWDGLPPKRFMRDLAFKAICSIYYVHPAAQSEIGFGGPAAPRGYVRLGADRQDTWEAAPGIWEKEGDR